ncbi:MAG: response regulator transcription factor [Candidatus Enteromonas sp.]|nr:response regulator transcription factor [Candidatus Enteromonas sp.]MDY6093540.1 response regulator transcription factor [Candidatus Enteromonas sp.]
MANYIIDVVESSPTIMHQVSEALRGTKFTVRGFVKATPFLNTFAVNPPDLAIIDLRIFDEYGINVLKKIRSSEGEKRDTRVILIGTSATCEDRCNVYHAGGDGYLSFPFEPRELYAMVIAQMRRVQKRKEVIHWGPFTLDKIEREARKLNQTLNLTNCEFLIYQVLMEAQGAVVTREQLYVAFGDPHKPYDPRSKALDMHIKSLREKLGEGGRFIESIYGGGYRLLE